MIIFLLKFATLTHCIIGGQDALSNEAPFVVQIIHRNNSHCTGSIIGPDTVLTAAHCTDDVKNVDDKLEIIYGTLEHYDYLNSSNWNSTEFMVEVKSYHNHPLRNDALDREYDISVLKLARPILPSPFASSLNMAWDGLSVECDAPVRMYGFGDSSPDGDSPRKLQVASSSVINNCVRNWLFDFIRFGNPIYPIALNEMEEMFIVTEKSNSTACDGDSGGPLISASGDLIGVLSHNLQNNETYCEKGDSTYFVKVYEHWSFIKKYL